MILLSLFSKRAVLALGHCDSYFPGANKISIAKIFYENRWRFDADFETGYKGLRLCHHEEYQSFNPLLSS